MKAHWKLRDLLLSLVLTGRITLTNPTLLLVLETAAWKALTKEPLPTVYPRFKLASALVVAEKATTAEHETYPLVVIPDNWLAVTAKVVPAVTVAVAVKLTPVIAVMFKGTLTGVERPLT